MLRELLTQSRIQLRIDPLKELDEALMDRMTAQMTLKDHVSTPLAQPNPKIKVNCSNFDKSSLPSVQTFKRLSQKQAEVTPGASSSDPANANH